MIRLVTFDALHTLVTPRLPIHIQYSEVFAPYLGVLDPDAIARSFKTALKQVSLEKPAYQSGVSAWWAEIIRRTASGAGADSRSIDDNIDQIVPRLIHRFSSREGYKLFDDASPALESLKSMNVQTGLVTNSDSRILSVLEDLGILHLLSPVLVSEQEGMEKPSLNIFLATCARAGVKRNEALHVGDDVDEDYRGAWNAGMTSILLRRPGPEGDGERKKVGEDASNMVVVSGLNEVVDWVRKYNADRNKGKEKVLYGWMRR